MVTESGLSLWKLRQELNLSSEAVEQRQKWESPREPEPQECLKTAAGLGTAMGHAIEDRGEW